MNPLELVTHDEERLIDMKDKREGELNCEDKASIECDVQVDQTTLSVEQIQSSKRFSIHDLI